MLRFFENTFAMTHQGAKDLRNGIISHFFVGLSFMLPVIIAFMFLDEYLGVFFNNMNPTKTILFYILLSVAFFVIIFIFAYIDYGKLYGKIYAESAERRIKLAEKLRKLPMAFFGKKDISDLSATIMEDATQIETLFSHAVPQLFAAILNLIVMAIAMFIYNWQMSIALFWVVPISLVIFLSASNLLKRESMITYLSLREVSDKIQDGFDMVQEIKSYNQEDAFLNTLNTTVDSYEKNLIRGELLAGALMNLSGFLLKLGFPSIVFAGAFFLANGTINIFTYLVFLVIVTRIYDPFLAILMHFATLLVLEPRINRIKEMDAMPTQEGKKDFNPPNFDIEFKDVSFSYLENIQTLRNVSFMAKQGEVTAIVGPSGGGKSTAVKLAARFWDINQGTITVGGEDISTIEPEALLKHFAIVFQDVALFNSSVLENIRLGKKDATDEEVKKAASLAQCDYFVQKLPNGYDTLIGENGEKLSGGERQRISIARALLKDAPIILLDEATASLDAENESKIQTAISALVKNKTVLIIAHRMRTVSGADKIVALKDGCIAEMGTPHELKKQGGLFASMLARQNKQ